MWNNSAFGDGANSGYFNSSNQVDSPQQKSKGALKRLQSVVPVCIRQIKDHPEDEFKLFGMGTQILTIVGILREFEVQSTKANYEIEDHTGKIKAIVWLDNEASATTNLPLVKEGFYVRVYGSLRVQAEEKLLMVLRMIPLDNLNEVTNHLLEVIHTRLQAEALSKGPGPSSKIKQNNPGAELANSMSFMDVDMGANPGPTGFTTIQEKVYRLLQPVNSASGLHRSAILQQFPSNNHREVDAALEFLINEGHAYSTIDNDHFKATDSI